MMKLSELIQIAIEALDEDAQQELSFIAYPRHETRYDELRQSAAALRAIAPALVAVSEFVTRPHSPPRGVDFCDCAGCELLDVLKAAGVTCE